MKKHTKVILASMAGNILEFYDFALYGVFSSIIAQNFFPAASKFTSLLFVFATFALGYVTRPLGAIIFGYLGDSIGRKRTLALTILSMAIPSVIIGLLPTYEQIGIWAPVILVLCRLTQGISAGGEYNGAAIFMIEHSSNRKAFAGSLATVSGAGGGMLAMLIGSIFLDSSLPEWAWRLPFFMGIVLGGVGFYIRQRIEESPEFLEVLKHDKKPKIPLFEAIRMYPLEILCCIGGAAFSGALSSASVAFMPTYLIKFVGIPEQQALFLNSISYFAIIVAAPFVGILADRIGQAKVMTVGTLAIIFLSIPIFLLIQTKVAAFILGALLLLKITSAGFVPILNAFMNKLFPARIRYSGIAFGYGMGMILGGLMPVVSVYAIQKTNNLLSPGLYLMFIGVIGLLIIWGGERLYIRKKGIDTGTAGANEQAVPVSI